MKIEPRRFRIGLLAKELGIERFVIRFWEKEFGIKSYRSQGGQRFYDIKDVEKFKKIKHLLYEQKFAIAGAKKYLKGKSQSLFIPSQKITAENSDFFKKCQMLKEQLVKIKEQLS